MGLLKTKLPLALFLSQQKLKNKMKDLSPVARRFILHWGEMGTRWGINRTVAQIHALLFIAEHPLHAEDICGKLEVARSNVSNSLRELQNWGIVKVVHLADDRRDHFESMKDVYEMFRVIAAERKRREIDPTLQVLRECVATGEGSEGGGGLDDGEGGEPEAFARERIGQLLEFFEVASSFYDKANRLPTQAAVKAFKMGDKMFEMMGLMTK
ncbi:GbsR/MarR family transcriptional regulator [soil metagenome]